MTAIPTTLIWATMTSCPGHLGVPTLSLACSSHSLLLTVRVISLKHSPDHFSPFTETFAYV